MKNKFNYLFFLLFMVYSCKKGDVCDVVRDNIDYSFKDNEYYYNNWDRRNSSFNIGFSHPTNSNIFNYDYIKNTLKKKDTVYFMGGKVEKDNSYKRNIYKVYLNDSINILDTLGFPTEIKDKKIGYGVHNNFGDVIISPNHSLMLFTYYIYDSISESGSIKETRLIFYDIKKWKKIFEFSYNSQLVTNDLAWSPNNKNIIFYDNIKGDIILLNIENGIFSELITENEYSHINPKWGNNNDYVYFVRNGNTLIKLNVNTKTSFEIFKCKKYLFKRESINEFFILDNNDIYLELTGDIKFIYVLFAHYDCILKDCK